MPTKKTKMYTSASSKSDAAKDVEAEVQQKPHPAILEEPAEQQPTQAAQVEDQQHDDSDNRDRKVNIHIREKIQMSPDSPLVYHPRYLNKEKTRIKAIVRLPDGRLAEMEADIHDTKSPLVRDVFAQYSADEIDLFTERQTAMAEVRRSLDQRIMEDKQLSSQREITYQAKAEAFEIPEVNDECNKEIKSKIRQAHNVTEVTALTAIAIMRVLYSDQE